MSPQEHYRFIRSQLARNGVTNAAISREAKVSRQFVFDVFKGKSKGYRVRQITAKLCNTTVETIWPDTPTEYRRAA